MLPTDIAGTGTAKQEHTGVGTIRVPFVVSPVL
jgi:hypothetical protein